MIPLPPMDQEKIEAAVIAKLAEHEDLTKQGRIDEYNRRVNQRVIYEALQKREYELNVEWPPMSPPPEQLACMTNLAARCKCCSEVLTITRTRNRHAVACTVLDTGCRLANTRV